MKLANFFNLYGRVLTLGTILLGSVLFLIGSLCSCISVFYLIRKSLEQESKARSRLAHHCHEKLTPKSSCVSCGEKGSHKTTCVHNVSEDKENRRRKFRWRDSLSWKSFSKSILVESEEATAHNEYLIAEISKVIKHIPRSSSHESARSKLDLSDSNYFKLPFRHRLQLEEMIKKIALDGVTLCNCHRCTVCHCHLDRAKPLNKDEPLDIDAFYANI